MNTTSAAAWVAASRAAAAPPVQTFPRRVGRVRVRRLWTCEVCGAGIPLRDPVLKREVAERQARVRCASCEGKGGGR